MIKKELLINKIPAILWGSTKDKIFIAVHGNMSHKSDDLIIEFAKVADKYGYQVLSFDLPEHGDRRNGNKITKVQDYIQDLDIIVNYVKERYNNFNLFACSMGAYFSLLTYKHESFKQALFVSPVVDMYNLLNNMMKYFNISEDQLEKEKEIETPVGQTLYWDYYSYVKSNPIKLWTIPTSILYGSKDNICDLELLSQFTKYFNCNLEIMNNGEHYFHTKDQLSFFSNWTDKYINKI